MGYQKKKCQKEDLDLYIALHSQESDRIWQWEKKKETMKKGRWEKEKHEIRNVKENPMSIYCSALCPTSFVWKWRQENEINFAALKL